MKSERKPDGHLQAQGQVLSHAEGARIQAGIAPDPDNPQWTAHKFWQAKPLAKASLANHRRYQLRSRRRSTSSS